MELSNPQAFDAATYRLHAANNLGESSADIRLNIDVPRRLSIVAAPVFTAKPTIAPTTDGGAVFNVRLTAYPEPKYEWFKNSEALSLAVGSRYTASTVSDGINYQLTLTINNITKADSGSYRVTAWNEAGQSNANINLNLEGEPEVCE